MYWVIALGFFGFPSAMGVFLCWRAYQLAVNRRVGLANQWLMKETPGIERYARLFAARDLILALGCFLFVGLLLTMPAGWKVWIPMLTVFSCIHQCITSLAMHRVSRADRKMN
jgi:hypothetical protein